MSSVWRFYALAVLVILSALVVSSKTLAENEQAHYGPDLALMDDDGSLDAALINYLFARQMIKKLQNNLDVTDLQRKRSYWKQCAFNAVSCFGGK